MIDNVLPLVQANADVCSLKTEYSMHIHAQHPTRVSVESLLSGATVTAGITMLVCGGSPRASAVYPFFCLQSSIKSRRVSLQK